MIKHGKPTKNGKVKLTFILPREQVPGATSVVGDFNDWDPFAHPLRSQDDGTFQVSVTVPCRQELRFRYLADGGVWFDDPEADRYDEHGGYLSPVTMGYVWEVPPSAAPAVSSLASVAHSGTAQ
ncbi:MAG TPA: isoamylase early set domain-containing protein [Thermopolyspora sp.]